MSHSIAPVEEHDRTRRARVGTAQCARPYDVALLNISAMSFGSLSARAIEALDPNPKVTLHDYPGLDHGFAATSGNRRAAAGAKLADGRTRAFFAGHLP